MASKFVHRRAGGCSGPSDSSVLNEAFHSTPWWSDPEEQGQRGDALREQLKEMDEHVARLQDTLRTERAKAGRLQLRCSQQEGELRLREQQSSRLKERLALQAERPRERAATIEVLNFPPGSRGKREQPINSCRSTAKREEAALRVLLECREAELREAVRLRHSLTTLLHALRLDMEHTLSEVTEVQDEVQPEDRRLDRAEAVLGDHVTGGVVQSWREVQRRLGVISRDPTAVGSDHDKLLARLEADLRESQQLVRVQQQLLQDSLASPVPPALADCHFLEEWERLQRRWAELDQQRRSFETERQSFTNAAIRLSHERRDFEQQKACALKQQYLCESILVHGGTPSRRESSVLDFSGLGPSSVSGCRPMTPSPPGAAVLSGLGGVRTPSTPELYSALDLSYDCKFVNLHSQQ